MLDHILSILIFFPALAGIFGFLIQKESIRAYGVSVGLIEFVLSLVLWYLFDNNVSGMQFMESIPLIPACRIHHSLALVGISLVIILLSALVTFLGIASLIASPGVRPMRITLL